MAFPYYRFFPGDYLRDTRRLTLLQHGAYHLLIHEYMAAGKPLRGDLDAMCRVCGALSGEERKAVEFVLAEFFSMDGPLWRHKRCDDELQKLSDRTESAKGSAMARWGSGGSANAMRTHSERNANQNQNQNQNQNHIPEPEPPSPTKNVGSGVATAVAPPPPKTVHQRATRLSAEWRIPDEWAEWACEVYNLDRQLVVRKSLTFRDYWIAKPGAGGCKLDWSATWRNWIRKDCGDA